MTYFVIFLGICFMLGVLAVASNPSPYYGVVGLVVASVIGCGWLVSLGVSFVSLALFLVYLGGILVVFVYSVSLAADPYPEAWGDWRHHHVPCAPCGPAPPQKSRVRAGQREQRGLAAGGPLAGTCARCQGLWRQGCV